MFSIDLNDKQLANFWKSIEKKDENFCWYWLGRSNYAGTGVFSNGLRNATVAKIVYYLTYGDFEDNLHVIPKCLTSGCVNPKHLYLGDRVELNKNRELIIEKAQLKYKKNQS